MHDDVEACCMRARLRVEGMCETGLRPALCLFYAAAFLLEAERAGLEGWMLQGGSAWWPRLPEADSERMDAGFGYWWDDDSAREAMAEGVLPEVHFWCANALTLEVVDLAAGHFPAQARRLQGLDWDFDLPPETLRCHVEDLPPRVGYVADHNATRLGLVLAINTRAAFLALEAAERRAS